MNKTNKEQFIEKWMLGADDMDKEILQDLDTLITSAVSEAVEEERERCAKCADEYINGDMDSEQNMYATIISRAIRKTNEML